MLGGHVMCETFPFDVHVPTLHSCDGVVSFTFYFCFGFSEKKKKKEKGKEKFYVNVKQRCGMCAPHTVNNHILLCDCVFLSLPLF